MGNWAVKCGRELPDYIDSLAELESLMCASQTGLVFPESSFPEFVESDEPSDNAYFEGKNLVHPLLDHVNAVSNSVTIDKDIAIITGSNMSGKTTLIRTVGVCTVLAMTGGMVPAAELKLGRMRVMSSMRIVDSLEENMSTFKAELLRISGIVSAAGENKPLLFLIDEIFRGTNSDDRTEGALTVLKKLSRPYICGMMTTHDYAMIDKTEKDFKNIRYYHFSETYTDTGITFDYKLAQGISRQSNAKYLMKLVGIE
jgi:DNA mismatch repair ATPase MutS